MTLRAISLSRIAMAIASALTVVGGFSSTPAAASPVVVPLATAAAADASPLCSLEGGQSFAVDAGQGTQEPNDPLVYPFVMAGDVQDVSVIPCWPNGSAPADTWIISVTAYLGADNTLVSQSSGLHTADPFTLTLNGSGGVPATVTKAPLTIHTTDNHGVERSATIMVELLTPCADDKVIGLDTGAAHLGTFLQVDGAAAQLTVIPCSPDTSSPPTTWITAITAWVYNGNPSQHPAAEVTGLQATAPVTVELKDNDDGTAFGAGERQLSVDVTDNHGNTYSANRQMWVENPITAMWSIGTTQPDLPTTVRASFDNKSGSPVKSVTFQLNNADGVGDQKPANLAADLSHADSTMTFAPSTNRIFARVKLANGIIYPLAGDEVIARYLVDTTISAPDSTTWSDATTFHAKSVSTSGVAPSGLTLHLQSRASGSTTWVNRAVATTGTRGTAALTVPAATTGTAVWRVTSSETKRQRASTSPTHVVQVHAAFGQLPGARSIRLGQGIRYRIVIKPSNGARVITLVHRIGSTGWTKAGHTITSPTATSVPVWITRSGAYKVRLIVLPATGLAQTTSPQWDLRVTG